MIAIEVDMVGKYARGCKAAALKLHDLLAYQARRAPQREFARGRRPRR